MHRKVKIYYFNVLLMGRYNKGKQHTEKECIKLTYTYIVIVKAW